MTALPESYAFPREARVLRSADFKLAHESPAFAADEVLVVKLARNESAGKNGANTRLGLSVSRKVGNAVMRNRWKRRIREAFRLARPRLPIGIDIVVRPRRGGEPDFAAIQQSLPQLVARAARKLPRL
jgi:ribonuclease P protein component